MKMLRWQADCKGHGKRTVAGGNGSKSRSNQGGSKLQLVESNGNLKVTRRVGVDSMQRELCLIYTFDAVDDSFSGIVGGRRIGNKKTSRLFH